LAGHIRKQAPLQPPENPQSSLIPWNSLNCSILLTDIAALPVVFLVIRHARTAVAAVR
jgi:hypothetical protein